MAAHEDCAECRRRDKKRLLQIAAALATGREFISTSADDNPRSTPKSILRQAEKQRAVLVDWAHEIGQIARRIK